MQQPGYAYIYLSNDNGQPLEVFFDDFTVELAHSAIVQVDNYYPFGLTFNGYRRENSMMNRFLYNGGSEWQDSFGLNWYSTMNRPYDPVLGRFWGVDALSDLMPAISPMAYAYNNPLLFFDPTGLTGGIPGCPDCKGINVGEVTITAPRLPAQDYSAMFYDLASHSNPVYRNIGVQFERGNYDYLSHAFNQRAISYGEGIGYETEFMKGLNSIGEGLTTGLLYASFGSMAAPIIVYGSPLLMKSGVLSLSGGLTKGIATRVGVEVFSQTVVNMTSFGLEGWRNLDMADVIISASGLNFVSGSALSSSVDWRPFSMGIKFQAIGNGKKGSHFVTDFSVGLISGGQSKLLNSSGANKTVVNVFNIWNTTKTNALGEVVKNNIE